LIDLFSAATSIVSRHIESREVRKVKERESNGTNDSRYAVEGAVVEAWYAKDIQESSDLH
jgi:hypothetical protein